MTDQAVLIDRINQFLIDQLAQLKLHNCGQLVNAMEYTLLNGGKRMRPLLVYATAESTDVNLEIADHIAAAIEMIHAYSLIHDDLPAMDDDDLRRGQATCHIKFNEATAILAADALQALAFECLTQTPVSAEIKVKIIKNLSQAAGAIGMVGGQMLDLEAENKNLSISELETVHAKKTGAILQACVTMVTDCNDLLTAQARSHYQQFAENFGMAYQITDDVLDVTSDTLTLGKPAKSDVKNKKSTYPSLLGLQQAKNKGTEHIKAANKSLSQLTDDVSHLSELTTKIQLRKH